MTRSFVLTLAAAVLTQVGLAGSVSAQQQSLPDHPWSHGTTLAVSAGTAMAPDADVRPHLGAGFGWEINPRVSVEGSGSWIVTRDDHEGFAAELTALANLTRRSRVVPFVGAGIGLFHASFDTTKDTIPEFYRKRLEPSGLTTQSFNDPSFVFEGGVNFYAADHVTIRPVISVRLVTSGSDAYPVTLAAINVAYHFERHAVGR